MFFKKLFEKIENAVIESMVIKEPLSQYSRKIWFLNEWLMQQVLNIPDLKAGNYVPLIDEKLQLPASFLEHSVNGLSCLLFRGEHYYYWMSTWNYEILVFKVKEVLTIIQKGLCKDFRINIFDYFNKLLKFILLIENITFAKWWRR